MGTIKRICLISLYSGTLLNIKKNGIIKADDNKDQKFYFLNYSLFFSVKGINIKPSKINIGNFNINQVGI